jgi:hypothetical protein
VASLNRNSYFRRFRLRTVHSWTHFCSEFQSSSFVFYSFGIINPKYDYEHIDINPIIPIFYLQFIIGGIVFPFAVKFMGSKILITKPATPAVLIESAQSAHPQNLTTEHIFNQRNRNPISQEVRHIRRRTAGEVLINFASSELDLQQVNDADSDDEGNLVEYQGDGSDTE